MTYRYLGPKHTDTLALLHVNKSSTQRIWFQPTFQKKKRTDWNLEIAQQHQSAGSSLKKSKKTSFHAMPQQHYLVQ